MLGLKILDIFTKQIRFESTHIAKYSWLDTTWTWTVNKNCHPYFKLKLVVWAFQWHTTHTTLITLILWEWKNLYGEDYWYQCVHIYLTKTDYGIIMFISFEWTKWPFVTRREQWLVFFPQMAPNWWCQKSLVGSLVQFRTFNDLVRSAR